MILLLGQPEDADMVWAAVSLRDRGHHVEILMADDLVLGSQFSLRLTATAQTWELTLADGALLKPDQISIVVNRLTSLAPRPSGRNARDEAYLEAEWRAALVAWLRMLNCPVLNPPQGASLSGPQLSTVEWRALGHAFGLTCPTWRSEELEDQASATWVTCVVDLVLDPQGALDASTCEQLTRMARHAGAPLLATGFDVGHTSPQLLTADPLPPLRAAGNSFLDALEWLVDRRSSL